MPVSTTVFNLKVLQKAGLIRVNERLNARGKEKIISRKIDLVTIDLMQHSSSQYEVYCADIPIGSYFDIHPVAPCGLANEDGNIGKFDNIDTFFSPERAEAQLLWMSGGWVEYRIPNGAIKGREVVSLSIIIELCSEAPNYNNNWLSDITFWVNGIEVCTFLCEGDYGGRRGRLNPKWLHDSSTQFGVITNISVTENVVYINETGVAGLKISKLMLDEGDYISLRIGNKDDAKNVGGFNIFGEKMGDYSQNILFKVDYK